MTHLAGLLIAVPVTAMGLIFSRRLKVPFTDSAEALLFSAVLGAGLTAYLVFILGSFGFLYSWLFWLLFAVIFAVGLPHLVREVRGLSPFKGLKTIPWWAIVLISLGVMVIVFTAFGVAVPETGQDALTYHLAQPVWYLREGKILEVPWSKHTLWPSLMQMLFTLGVLLKDSSLAKFFHFFLYLCTGTAVYTFLRNAAGRRTAFFAAVIYFTVPGFYIQAAFSYVDNALACYCFFAFYALHRFFEARKLSWALLAGCFSGFALSVKLIGLFLLPLIGGYFLYEFIRTRGGRGEIVRAVLAYGLMLLAFGSLWYLRSALLRGNPVFPFYPDMFGGNGWHDPTYVDAHGRRQGFFDFFLLLWDITLYPKWFGGEHIGPVFLVFLPLLIFARKIPRAVIWAVLFGTGYSVLWFITDPNIRFLYPALTFFSVGAGYAVSFYLRIAQPFLRGCAIVPFLFLIAVQSSFAGYHFYKDAPYFFNPDFHSYLMERERSYRAFHYLKADLEATDRILSAGETRGFYSPSYFIQEGEFHLFTNYDHSVNSAEELARYFESAGFTHILWAEIDPDYTKGQGPYRVARILQEDPDAGRFFIKVREADFPDHDTRYHLYRITV